MIARIGAALAAVLLTVLAAAPAQARWLRAESPKFIVYSQGSESALKDYVLQLEEFDYLLRFENGLKLDELPPRKLPIYLVHDRDEMLRTDPGIGPNVGGYYIASLGDIFAVVIRDEARSNNSHASRDMSDDGRESIIFHEYTHHFMLQYFPLGYPTWLVEGFAEYFGTTTIKGSRIEVGRFAGGRTENLLHDKWVPIRDVLGKRLDEIPEGEGHAMFYAQAWLMTHYFVSDPQRAKQLKAYMLAIGAGADPVDALQKTTGLTPEALDKVLHDYLHGGLKYAVISHTGGVAPPITVTTLPASADDVMLEGQLIRLGLPRQELASYVVDLKDKARRWPGDRTAELALARALINGGDRKAGEALLDSRLASDPSDVEALELAGQARLDDGDEHPERMRELYVEAAPFLAKAYKLDPNRYQTLYSYTRSRRVLDKDYPSDNTLEALLAALEYAPQVHDVRLSAARGMMRRERWANAREILSPLANDPHGGGASTYARQLIKQAVEEEARAKAAGR